MAVYLNESLTISKTLSKIGYSRYMRTVRQNVFKCIETSLNNRVLPLEPIFSGSKAEGISALFENDIDLMNVPINIVCSEYPVRYRFGEQKNTFHLSKRYTAPGYTLLKLATICESLPDTDLIKVCLVELLPGQLYISSVLWQSILKEGITDYFLEPSNTGLGNTSNENHGPATAMSVLWMNYDNVYAMTCYCPSYLYSWMTRKRQHNWPTADVIEEVSELESHVVPVGSIHSPLKSMEWRICYTKGEIRLIRSLPDFLIKVYILVKAIVKVTLKPICKDISSYIMKNIVLWIAELNPVERLSDRDLVTILQHAFKFLKTCLLGNNLPSYMIPDRNLFADRLTLQHRSRLCMRIDCLLREGPRVVLRVKKMRDAFNVLYSTPEEFQLYFKRRQIIEVLMLIVGVYTTDKFLDENSNMERSLRNIASDDFVNRIFSYIFRLVPEMADTSGDGNGDARFRIDPEFEIRTIREVDEDILIRNHPLFKYVS